MRRCLLQPAMKLVATLLSLLLILSWTVNARSQETEEVESAPGVEADPEVEPDLVD